MARAIGVASSSRWAATVIVWVAIGVAVPHVFGSGPNTLLQLDYILVLLMVASGLNIVLGFAGLLFLGPSALTATGGYAAAVLAMHFTPMQGLPAMCLVSVIAAVILAAIIAIPALRIGGFYLGMVTLFAALLVPDVAGHMKLTGGGSGLSLLTNQSFVQRPTGLALYYLGLLLVAVMAGYAWLIKNSRLGRRFGAIMASEELAQSLGIRPYATKLAAFMLAAVPCGIAGAFYVYSQQFISPDSVSPTMSLQILAGMVIGGGGTILGPLIGTALVGSASQFLGSFEKYQGLVYGAALVGAAIGLPYGLMGLYRGLQMQYRARKVSSEGLVEPVRPSHAIERVGDGASHLQPDEVAQVPGALDKPLVIKGVSRSFGGVQALDDVDLVVEPGRVHALVGPNGSGKTTLLNLISGFYRTDGGSISLGKHRLDGMRAPQVARLGVARTFQTPKLLIGNSVLDNVVVAADRSANGSLTGAVLHVPSAQSADRDCRSRAAAALHHSGLTPAADAYAELIPHGTQRLLEIARAIALEPTFVLLDEPAAGLSAAEVDNLNLAVKAMAEAGFGVLIVEHNLPVVFGLADEVTVLHQGRVIATGTPAEVASDPEVIRVYLGRRGRPRPATEELHSPAGSGERRA